MILNSIKLTNFRNHEKFEASFDPQITIINGPNAAGKTNILEGVYTLATTKPFRAKYDRDSIMSDKEFA